MIAIKPMFTLRRLLIAIGALIGVSACGLYENWPAVPAEKSPWEKVVPRLEEAEEAATKAANTRVGRVREFFAERRVKARRFGEEVLSLSGKWAFVKSKLPFTDADGHRVYLRERFEAMVLSSSDLDQLIQCAVNGYVVDLGRIENDLLVNIRADLSDCDLSSLPSSVSLDSDAVFREQFHRSLEKVTGVVSKDVNIAAGREVGSWIAGNVAGNITVSLGVALAERLGVSAGVLGTGAWAGAATLGTGIVAAIIVDMALDWVFQAAGYDPAGEIANKISSALDALEAALVEGDKSHSGKDSVGLEGELRRVKDVRCKLREEAIKNLFLEGGGP